MHIFEVGTESRKTVSPATGAAYGPFENPRQQLSSRFYRVTRCRLNDPGTAALFQLLEERSNPIAAVAVAGGAPRCPSAGSGHLGGSPNGRNPKFAWHDVFLTRHMAKPPNRVGITLRRCNVHLSTRHVGRRIVPVSWRYSSSTPLLQLPLARFGVSPGRRLKPVRESASRRSPANGGRDRKSVV